MDLADCLRRVARFPSEDRANAGYHIEGSYDGPGGYWVNVRSNARGLLALFLFLTSARTMRRPAWYVARTWQSRSFWPLMARQARTPMPSSGVRQRCACWSPTPPAGLATSTYVIHSSCTPPPGRTGARCRG